LIIDAYKGFKHFVNLTRYYATNFIFFSYYHVQGLETKENPISQSICSSRNQLRNQCPHLLDEDNNNDDYHHGNDV